MSNHARDVIRKLALGTYKDPTASTKERQLARSVLYLMDGKSPK